MENKIKELKEDIKDLSEAIVVAKETNDKETENICTEALKDAESELAELEKDTASVKDKKVYAIRDREAGNVIDTFSSKEEAEMELKKYEEKDKKEDVFEEDFYEIVKSSKKTAKKTKKTAKRKAPIKKEQTKTTIGKKDEDFEVKEVGGVTLVTSKHNRDWVVNIEKSGKMYKVRCCSEDEEHPEFKTVAEAVNYSKEFLYCKHLFETAKANAKKRHSKKAVKKAKELKTDVIATLEKTADVVENKIEAKKDKGDTLNTAEKTKIKKQVKDIIKVIVKDIKTAEQRKSWLDAFIKELQEMSKSIGGEKFEDGGEVDKFSLGGSIAFFTAGVVLGWFANNFSKSVEDDIKKYKKFTVIKKGNTYQLVTNDDEYKKMSKQQFDFIKANFELVEERKRTNDTLYDFSVSDKIGYFADGGSVEYGKGGEIGDIATYKKQLISKAKSKGIYENFGQKEVRKLEDKYGYTSSVAEFDNWAMNFDLSQI